MEHSFRIAIWMCLLLGFLQARPTLDGLINDLGFTFLKQEVSCSENVTFASPAVDMTENCTYNSLTVMKEGLEQAQKNCTDTNPRVTDALFGLGLIKKRYPKETSSFCASKVAGNWTQFLTECEKVFERLNSKQ